eukprot:g6916.t1
MQLTLWGALSAEPLEIEVDASPKHQVFARAIKEAVSRKLAAENAAADFGSTSTRPPWQPWQLCELFVSPETATELGVDSLTNHAMGAAAAELGLLTLDEMITLLKETKDGFKEESSGQSRVCNSGTPERDDSDSCGSSVEDGDERNFDGLIALKDEALLLDLDVCARCGLRYFVKSFRAFESREELDGARDAVVGAIACAVQLFGAEEKSACPPPLELRSTGRYDQKARLARVLAFPRLFPDQARITRTLVARLQKLRTIYDTYGPFVTWDVHKVKDLSGLFRDQAISFEYGVAFCTAGVAFTGWNVGGVTDMSDMFRGFYAWSVTEDHMFATCNGRIFDLSGWDVSSVAQMDRMFSQADNVLGVLGLVLTAGVT